MNAKTASAAPRSRPTIGARFVAATIVAAAVLFVASAHATAASISAPTPASLAKNRPVFTITNTGTCDAGTKANWFYLSRTSARRPQVENGHTFLTNLENTSQTMGGRSTGVNPDLSTPGSAFTFTTPGPALIAGRYFVQISYWNLNPSGLSWSCGLTSGQPGSYNPRYSIWIPFYTPPQSFTIPVQLRAARVTTVYQFPRIPQMNALGRVTTNAGAYRYTCAVFKGTKRITATASNGYLAAPSTAAKWSCYGLRVPESLDGTRLTLKVVVTAGKSKTTTTRQFIAR